MKRILFSVLLCIAFASPALAKELAGVQMEDTLQVAGKNLKLNGLGLRKKFVFEVYVAGLYVERTTADGAKIITSDETRVVQLAMKRDLSKGDISKSLHESFVANAGDKLPALQKRLDTFIAAIPAVKANDVLMLQDIPGKGTSVRSKTGAEVTVEGKDFAEVLFSIFVGGKPVDGHLKQGLLGKS